MKRLFSLTLLATILFSIVWVNPSLAGNYNNGAKIFNAICAACHWGGGNVIINSKTLKEKDLRKYNIASLRAIKYQVKNGKNVMPAFEKRLNDQQIEDVATYVLQQAKKGWSVRSHD